MLQKILLRNNAWYPQKGAQLLGYINAADELFYGGQAGGGKTDLGLGLAFTDHTRSIIFRRTYPQIEALEARSREIGDRVNYRYNNSSKRWYWGIKQLKTLQFGAIQYDHDKSNYKGRPFDLMVFDEICEFLESQYTFIIAWNRTVYEWQRARVLATGNPPTDADGAWVIDYWAPWLDDSHANPARPGELRYFIRVKGESVEVDDNKAVIIDKIEYLPSSRSFIPATLDDNRFLKDTDYERKLHGLPEPLRSQLLCGDFGLSQQDDQWQIIPTEWVRIAQEKWQHCKIPMVVNGDIDDVRKSHMTHAGVDVARGGRDKTIIAPRYLSYVDHLIEFDGKDTPDGQSVAGQVITVVHPDTQINIDVIGVGSSPFDFLSDVHKNVKAVNSAERSDMTDKTGQLRFANKRSELWWRMREALDPEEGEGADIKLPPDRILRQELVSPRWKLLAGGRIQVEGKEDIKKRIGRSTDRADALIYSFDDVMPVGIIE